MSLVEYIQGELDALSIILKREPNVPNIKFMIPIPLMEYELKSNLQFGYRLAISDNVIDIALDHIFPKLVQAYIPFYSATCIIQRNWLKVYYDPAYRICQNRLRHEFYSLLNNTNT